MLSLTVVSEVSGSNFRPILIIHHCNLTDALRIYAIVLNM